MSHPEARRIEELAEGRLDREVAGEVRDHILACPRCRDALVAIRPTALFALLGGDQPAPEPWAIFRLRMRNTIEKEQALASPPRWRWRTAALGAAAALLAVAILWPAWRTSPESGGTRTGRTVMADAAQPGAEDRARTGLYGEAVWRERLAEAAGEIVLPAVEEVESLTARVIDLGVVTDDGMQLVVIVDEEIDL